MDTTAYQNLLDIFVEGVLYSATLPALLAFVVWLLFVYTAILKENADTMVRTFSLGRLFWLAFPALLSFILFAVILFIFSTPLSAWGLGEPFAFGLTFSDFSPFIASIFFLFLALWLYVPIKKRDKKKFDNGEDDDISMASVMSVLLGVALGELVLSGAWPKLLQEHATSVEVVNQASFYVLFYILGLLLVWLFAFLAFYSAIGRFVVGRVPLYAGVVALVVSAGLVFVL